MKLLAVLAVCFATANSAYASEVGTQKPSNVSKTEKTVALAMAEKGASTNWTVAPIEFKATSHQTDALNERVEEMNADISDDLDALIAKKLEKSLID